MNTKKEESANFNLDGFSPLKSFFSLKWRNDMIDLQENEDEDINNETIEHSQKL